MVEQRLLIFSKWPVPGSVKTRLIPAVGPEAACRLHCQLLDRTLAVAEETGFRTQLWLPMLPGQKDAEQAVQRLHDLIKGRPVSLHGQCGVDLGSRMAYAFKKTLVPAQQVVMVGSDCISLTANLLTAAFAALETKPAVFAPAVDGGYVLIGLREYHVELFQNIPWSTAEVYALTQQRLRQQGLDYTELPMQQDIDVAEDLMHLPKNFSEPS